MRQISLFHSELPVFGGELAVGQRKKRRPLSRGRPIHFTLKACQNLYTRGRFLEENLRRLCERFQLRIYDVAVAFDHVHFVATIPDRRSYVAFIRSFTGILARELGKKLWKLLPFSRVGNWGRDFLGMKSYLRKNREEADGVRPYEPRTDWYKRLRSKANSS